MLSIVFITGIAGCKPAATVSHPETERHRSVLNSVSEKISTLVSPGALSTAHSQSDSLGKCLDCHALFSETPAQNCLECHAIIGERQARSLGVHGGFGKNCSDCHLEHRGRETSSLDFDQKSFNHDQALFALHGKHREKECQDCHRILDRESGEKEFHYLGVAHETCATCHADPHEKEFSKAQDCAACHTEIAWSIAKTQLADDADSPSETSVALLDDFAGFSHLRDTQFALEGQHEKLNCQSCHTPEQRKLEIKKELPPGTSLSRNCVDCHEDPHERALGKNCADCHTPETWQKPKFEHSRDAKFALTAIHEKIECAACHQDSRFRAKGVECADCHAEATQFLAGKFQGLTRDADPHSSPKISCSDCHDPKRALERLSDYEAACTQCHAPTYGKLLLSKQHILDELVVESEAELRRIELFYAKHTDDRAAAERERMKHEIVVFAKNGAHHPELAEALLERTLENLKAQREALP